jgi:microcystin-dependent protein
MAPPNGGSEKTLGTPYLGEIKMVSFNFAPKGWAEANGQLMPINQNQALFSLYGTNFGGDGRVNFALPNLQTRVAMHRGAGHVLGEAGGENNHTLSQNEMPTHTHTLTAAGVQGTTGNPTGGFLSSSLDLIYVAPQSLVAMNAATIGNTGGSQPHTNVQPSLVINFIVALQGVFPSQN